MCFSGGMAVKGLEVNCSSGCAILFGTDDHAVAPCYWFSNWDGFKNSQSHIPVQAGFDGLLPVRGTGMGEWCATGVAFGSIISLMGGLSISGSA